MSLETASWSSPCCGLVDTFVDQLYVAMVSRLEPIDVVHATSGTVQGMLQQSFGGRIEEPKANVVWNYKVQRGRSCQTYVAVPEQL